MNEMVRNGYYFWKRIARQFADDITWPKVAASPGTMAHYAFYMMPVLGGAHSLADGSLACRHPAFIDLFDGLGRIFEVQGFLGHDTMTFRRASDFNRVVPASDREGVSKIHLIPSIEDMDKIVHNVLVASETLRMHMATEQQKEMERYYTTQFMHVGIYKACILSGLEYNFKLSSGSEAFPVRNHPIISADAKTMRIIDFGKTIPGYKRLVWWEHNLMWNQDILHT
tara:strand:- start:3123 stop:3800 length:678 start_codon:yes stop_codon:yes gene_type:complete